MEEFRDIQEYEGLYQVSNLGRVKSLKYGKEKILKGGKDKQGYIYVILCKEGKKNNFRVHRLVCETFIPNPNNYQCVNHKDEDKTNNNVNNLEWCNQNYNVNYGTGIQRRVANTDWKKKVENTDYKEVGRKSAEKLLNRKDQSKPVLQYTKDNEFVKEWKSTNECERNGFYKSAVSKCCNGKLNSHKGFIWKYK